MGFLSIPCPTIAFLQYNALAYAPRHVQEGPLSRSSVDAPGGAKSGSIPRHSVIFDRNLTAAAIGHSMVKRGLLQRAPHRTSVHPERPAGINFFNMKLYILAAVAIVLGVW